MFIKCAFSTMNIFWETIRKNIESYLCNKILEDWMDEFVWK